MNSSVVKVLETHRVFLPQGSGSVPPCDVPLTYFDVLMLSVPPVQQLFFYDSSLSTPEFRDSQFPLLKHSLSLALSIFYPFAGRLVPLTESYPGDSVIRYSAGDSVPLTLAESHADFARLAGNHSKEAKEFHPLLSPLELPEINSDGDDVEGKLLQELLPLVAFQVTVFPGSGVSVGFVAKHVVADGFAGTHFWKTWASIFKAGGDVSAVKGDLPVCDRSPLHGHELLQQLKRDHLLMQREAGKENQKKLAVTTSISESKPGYERGNDEQLGRVTRSTFVLTRAHIEKLRGDVFSSADDPIVVGPRQPSTFVVACAFVWTLLAKSRNVPGEQTVYLGCAADCRRRLSPPVPASYFGNCITLVVVEATQGELTGERGLVTASEAIHAAIRRLEEEGPALEDAESRLRKWVEVVKERPLTIAASPRFRMYDTDFGWGRARKVEIVSIDCTGAISMAENPGEGGGIEIGAAGPEEEMLRFTRLFEQGVVTI
ncbi:hypothetical protein H6P81_007432 [Aristolochia fimbriata]|uniref:Uncharacterized protein n=1 Tax=Aristolochia fimbriata TaxID=158543 RepID=A0AAV7F0H5_ARIFI|nr:hypothetical protein H6P81_007432 [Aristolochia fimbriata]